MDGISRSRGWDKEIPHGVLPMEQLVLSDKWARILKPARTATETNYNIEIMHGTAFAIGLCMAIKYKGAEHTPRMQRLVCAFVVHMQQSRVFSVLPIADHVGLKLACLAKKTNYNIGIWQVHSSIQRSSQLFNNNGIIRLRLINIESERQRR